MSSSPRIAGPGLKLAIAEGVGTLARWTGRGGGTSLPGKVLIRLEPQVISRLAPKLGSGCAVVSATNGKTTTAAMVAAILRRDGIRLVHNRTGANMPGGVASTLASAARRGGRVMDGDLGLFEVDELWLPALVEQLNPRVLLLGNLFRDQLDRHGELDSIAERWTELAAATTGRTRLVVCADDPLLAGIGQQAPDSVYFGVEDDELASPEMQHASDSKHCRVCGHPYSYKTTYLAHLGRWHCRACPADRPTPQVFATDVELRGIRSAAFTLCTPMGELRIDLPLPGLYNVYNALGAAALCLALGVELRQIAGGLQTVEPAFGRAETFALAGDHPMSVLLVKNPAGTNEVLRTLALEGDRLDLFGMLNDGIADGRDVSWIWDVDWEVLGPKVRHMTCSGNRAADLALRMKHAGVDPQRLHLVEDIGSGLDAALARSDGPLYALPTYTAMLELRDVLTSRGHTKPFWR